MNSQETMTQDRQQDIQTLRGLIKDIKVCMLATHSTESGLRSRPMITGRHEFDGDLWFFSHVQDPKVAELQRDSRVNLVYSDPERDRYISITGEAEVLQESQKLELLWRDELNEWFPKGPGDPDLTLIRVQVNEAEYWDADVNHLGSAVKALFFNSSQTQKHGKLDWSPATD